MIDYEQKMHSFQCTEKQASITSNRSATTGQKLYISNIILTSQYTKFHMIKKYQCIFWISICQNQLWTYHLCNHQLVLGSDLRETRIFIANYVGKYVKDYHTLPELQNHMFHICQRQPILRKLQTNEPSLSCFIDSQHPIYYNKFKVLYKVLI